MVWPAIIAGGAALAGSLINRRSSESAGNKNADLQREFAKNGIQWKVADAKKAGLHPLAALGAQTVGAAPAYVGDTSMGQAMASVGQDISRAMTATAARKDQARMVELQQEGQLQHNNLLFQQQGKTAAETELLNLQRRKLERELQNAPGVPVSSSGSGGSSALVSMEPSKQTRSAPGEQSREAYKGLGKPGFIPMRVGGDRHGFTLDVPNNELSEALEGMGVMGSVLGPLIWGAHGVGLKSEQWFKDLRRYGTPRK